MNRYILMHKNVPVADIELDSVTGVIISVGTVYHKEHFPVGIAVKKGRADRAMCNEWWRGRAIPASRQGIRQVLEELQVRDASLLVEKCLGLSLSDQYWICPVDSDIRWEQVNFFTNPFSEDMGNLLFGKKWSGEPVSLMSPDNTSDGWLKKKWKIMDGKRCLLKGGSGAIQQEPYNEVFASSVMERLGIPHVSYMLTEEDGYPYSVCEDFINPDTELVTAWYVMQSKKRANHVSVYQHYLECCEDLRIPAVKASLDRMLVLDYLIVNEDRHQNNFGVIRNAETLEYMGTAPVYDSGTSLWFDKPLSMVRADANVTCKPFKNSHEEQIRLVSSFDWLDFGKLQDISEVFREIVRGSLFVDQARCDAICRGIEKRVEKLQKVATQHGRDSLADDIQCDVKKNVAYSGTE